MNRIARKYFLPVLLGSVLVFAIDLPRTSAATPSNYSLKHFDIHSLEHLGDDGFWGKFRESVMKDRDKNEPGDGDPSGPSDDGDFGGNDRGGGHGGRGDGPGGGGHGDGGGRR